MGLDTLEAELVEIDENMFRSALSDLELSALIVQRKKIYEALHPERKRGGNRRGVAAKPPNWQDGPVKSFAEETAQLLGVSPRTVERHIQVGQKLTPETQKILKGTERNIAQQTMEKLTRLKPGQQEEAAALLARGEIHRVEQYITLGKQERQPGRGLDNASLYMEAFDQAAFQIRHLIGLFQQRRETYAGLLSAEQLAVLGGQAARTTAILDSFVASLNGGFQ